jgi:hypothetical protein
VRDYDKRQACLAGAPIVGDLHLHPRRRGARSVASEPESATGRGDDEEVRPRT